MRILVLTHLYPSVSWPTNGVFIHRHVEGLIERGVDLRVVVPVPWSPWPLRVMKPKWARYHSIAQEGRFGVADVSRVVVPIPPGNLQWLAGPTMAGRLTPFLMWLRRTFPFDLIHSHTATPDGWAAWWISRLIKVPHVCSVRGSDINEYPHKSPIRRWATNRALASAAHTIAVSRALAVATKKLTGRQATVIYNGVDSCFAPPNAEDRAKARRKQNLSSESTNVVFVGRCEPDKGVLELVSAFVELQRRHPGVHLTMVGSGSAYDTVGSIAKQHECADRLHQYQSVDHGLVRRFLHAADVFALPSYAEGMPNALLEAMACGLPCVASEVGGIPEVIVPRATGILVPPRSSHALEQAIENLLSEPSTARSMGTAAAVQIRRRHSWATNADQHVTVYRGVLAS